MDEFPVEMVSLRDLVESPSNPRRLFDDEKLEQLAASIRVEGILQPILARPTKGRAGYEIVFGARRFRAAKLAGLAHVPCNVRTLSDEEVARKQAVENDQREDVHPLEQAEAYRRLRDDFGKSAEEIAADVGRSKSEVYSLLKLTELGQETRELFFAGRLTRSTALLCARISDPERQARAAGEIAGTISRYVGGKKLREDDYEDPLTYREAQEHVREKFMLALAAAPFSTAAVDLVPGAGACTSCPKRTGNQRELFGDADKTDLCTDPKCFERKSDAAWKLRQKQEKERGREVMSEAEAKCALANSHAPRGFVRLDRPCYQDPKGRTYGELLKKVDELPVTVARIPKLAYSDPGKIVELVPEKGLKRALAKAGHAFAQPKKTDAKNASEAEKPKKAELEEWRIQAHVKRELVRQIVAVVVEAPTAPLVAELYRKAIQIFLAETFGDTSHAVARRAETAVRSYLNEDLELEASHLEKLSIHDLRGLAFELLLDPALNGSATSGMSELEALAKIALVDLKETKKLGAAAAKEEVQKACIGCGCTLLSACRGGCSWVVQAIDGKKVQTDLCSKCAAAGGWIFKYGRWEERGVPAGRAPTPAPKKKGKAK